MPPIPAVFFALAWLAQGPGDGAPPPRYGDRGTSDLSLGVGFGGGGFLAGAGFRRFIWPGVAPGVEGLVETGDGTTLGEILATARLVPVRTAAVALTLTAKGGRVLLSHHDDGWGAGGEAGVIFFPSQGVGLEIGYEVLRLLPARFCADLSSCLLHGPVIGLRLTL